MALVKPTARPDPALAEPPVTRVRIVRRDGRLMPIGPERLEELRQAILDGSYSVKEAAARGVERLLRARAKERSADAE